LFGTLWHHANKDYVGAWLWSLFPDHTSDKMAVDLNAARTFAGPMRGLPPPSLVSIA